MAISERARVIPLYVDTSTEGKDPRASAPPRPQAERPEAPQPIRARNFWNEMFGFDGGGGGGHNFSVGLGLFPGLFLNFNLGNSLFGLGGAGNQLNPERSRTAEFANRLIYSIAFFVMFIILMTWMILAGSGSKDAVFNINEHTILFRFARFWGFYSTQHSSRRCYSSRKPADFSEKNTKTDVAVCSVKRLTISMMPVLQVMAPPVKCICLLAPSCKKKRVGNLHPYFITSIPVTSFQKVMGSISMVVSKGFELDG